MSELQSLTAQVLQFREARDWRQFHNPKDMALSLTLEAAELLEIFQWKEGEAIAQAAAARRTDIADELADILSWLLLMSHDLGIDLAAALRSKIEANERKYPVEKSRGTSRKYTEL